MAIKRSLLGVVPALGLALLLAGCGGGGDPQAFAEGDGQRSGAGTPDGFIAQVMAIISQTSEMAEPEDIGSVNATLPESTEPVPLS